MVSRFSRSQKFIESKPQFRLSSAGRPANLSGGQRSIVFDCLASVYPRRISLDDIVRDCMKHRNYRDTLKTEGNIHKSILYHLNRIEAVEQCSN